MRYDVVVAGLGAMGSATAYQLAKRGAAVLGVDRHTPPHVHGSTHGDTRITRLAVGEGLDYVPLVRRSHQIWREVEQETGADLLVQCGVVVIAPEHDQEMHGSETFLDATIEAAREFDIPHELLGAEQLAARFPQFALSGDEQGYFEPTGGFVRPEACVGAQLELAQRYGATLRLGEEVLGYTDDGTGVTVHLGDDTLRADRLVICAGPWVSRLVPELASYVRIHRQVLHWFELADQQRYQVFRDLPVYIWWAGRHDSSDRDNMVYGFPMIDGPDGGAKIAREQYETTTDADRVDRVITDAEVSQMYDGWVRDRFPALGPRSVKAATCLYSVTPDSRFVIDRHPLHHNVVVASPCSGHGFKHSAAIGEVLAELAASGASTIDVSGFAFPARWT